MTDLWLTMWIRGGDTGTSSKTIAFALIGAASLLDRMDAPYDTADVGRCVRLLDAAAKNGEDWRARLSEVADVCPEWRPLVERWPEIEAAYREDEAAQNAHYAEHGYRPRSKRARESFPPSRCWWLVSALRGHGDPYRDRKPHPFAPEQP
jgi:hypothetical protein